MLSFNYYKTEGTILRSDYPYVDRQQNCRSAGMKRVAYTNKDRAFVEPPSDLQSFKEAIRNGPTGIAFGVSTEFELY